MPHHSGRSLADKRISAEDAARLVRPGDHVFVGTASATPRTLIRALEALRSPPADVELMHFLTDGALRTDERFEHSHHHRHRGLHRRTL